MKAIAKVVDEVLDTGNQTAKTEEIVRLRLFGEPVSKIADDVHVSRQYIYIVLSKFPKKPDSSHISATNLTASDELAIVIEYLHKLPTASSINKFGLDNCAREAVSLVSASLDVPAEVVYETLYKMTSRHASIEVSPYYRKVDEWRKRNAISLRQFADMIGIPKQRLREILIGWRHLPLEAAQKLSDASGLSIEEIYSDIIEHSKEGSV